MNMFADLRIRKAQLFLHDAVVVRSANVGSSGKVEVVVVVVVKGCGAAAGVGWRYGVSVCMWPR